jgi:hypothetical protein
VSFDWLVVAALCLLSFIYGCIAMIWIENYIRKDGGDLVVLTTVREPVLVPGICTLLTCHLISLVIGIVFFV